MFLRKKIKELERDNIRKNMEIESVKLSMSFFRDEHLTIAKENQELIKEIEVLKFKIQNPFKFNVLDTIGNYKVISREVKLKAYKKSCSHRLVNLYTVVCICDNTEITLTEKQLTKLKLK